MCSINWAFPLQIMNIETAEGGQEAWDRGVGRTVLMIARLDGLLLVIRTRRFARTDIMVGI